MKELRKLIKGTVRFNEAISRHTTFRIGGRVDVWIEPKDLDDLRNVLRIGRRLRRPVYIIGRGSNLLVNDKKINGIVIQLSNPFFRSINIRGKYVAAGAGISLRHLLRACIEKKLTGLEFCSGIPGTVGGAVAMNAGFGARNTASNIGNFVNRVTVIDRTGKIKDIKKRNLCFGYRTSSIEKFIILEVELELQKARRTDLKRYCKMILGKKRKTQELNRLSAGCIFRNPYEGLISAGKLIELAGLKAKKVGHAEISSKNANYIINLGKASFKDVKRLIDIVKRKIKEEFNIDLDLEVKIWK